MYKKKIRRSLVAVLLAFIIVLSCSNMAFAAITIDNTFTAYMVPNAHIDTAWRWPLQHTADTVISDTYGRAIAALKTNASYRFSASASKHYEYVEEYYPAYWNDLQVLVKNGQWDLTGGQVVETDLNIPSGESLVRQSLYAQHYFSNAFGKEFQPKTTFLVDTFGYSGQFPQIAKKSEMDYFVTGKLGAGGPYLALAPGQEYETHSDNSWRESDLFWWEAIDGKSNLLSYIVGSYGGSGFGTSDLSNTNSNNVFNRNNRTEHFSGVKTALGLYGSGDHGGGPTTGTGTNTYGLPASLDANSSVVPRVKMASVTEFFTETEDTQNLDNVFKYQGELYFQLHRGTYTSWSRMKKYNRQSEILAETAEKAATLSQWIGVAQNNSNERIALAWDKILTNQMHDILPGSSAPYVYYVTYNNHELAKNLLTNVQNSALSGMAYRADTNVGGTPVFVYNPSSWTRSNRVTVDLQFDQAPDNLVILDGAKELPVSIISKNAATGKVKVSFLANEVPAMGYKVFNAVASAAAPQFDSDLIFDADNWIIENSFLKMTLNPETGYIKSLINKSDNGREVFAQNSGTEANELHVYVDTGGNTFPAWDVVENELNKEPSYFVSGLPEVMKVVENNKDRVTIQVTKTWNNSTITQYITMYAGVERVDVRMGVDWNEVQRLLKVSFPILSDASQATYEIAYGALQRATTRDNNYNRNRFEVSGHKWMDVTNEAKTNGVSIFNDAKYGFDSLKKTVGSETFVRARMTVVRSPMGADIQYERDKYGPSPYYIDNGYQEFNYSIYPHKNSWEDANTTNKAYEFNYPMIAFQTAKSSGGMAGSHSFVSSGKDNVIITALKNQFDKPEDKNTFVLRAFESTGRDTNGATITLPSNVVKAKEVNLLEHVYYGDKKIMIDGNKITFDIAKYEILTIELELAPSGLAPVALAQATVDLSDYFNLDGVSSDANRRDGNFDGQGNTVPVRNWPNEIDYQGIKFKFASTVSDQEDNYVQAAGQTIPLPGGNYSKVYLVGASTGQKNQILDDYTVNYTDKTSTSKDIKFSGWRTDLSGWDRFEKADTKPYVLDSVAYVFTHYHNGVSDEMTCDNYLFVYSIDVDSAKTLSSITLPNNGDIKIAAISVSNSPVLGFASAYDNPERLEYDVTDLTFTLDGNDAANINVGEISFKANFGVHFDSKCVNLSIAAYKDGKMFDYASVIKDLEIESPGQQVTLETPTITIPDDANMQSFSVIGFIWDGVTMVPLWEKTLMGQWLRPPAPNLALRKTVTVSSGSNSGRVNDDDESTRWSASNRDGEWIYIDLGEPMTVSRLEVLWEAAFAKVFRIDVSNNASSWTTVFRNDDSIGGLETIVFSPVETRYVRLVGEVRALNYGFSIWEFRIFEY